MSVWCQLQRECARVAIVIVACSLATGTVASCRAGAPQPKADLILTGGRVYTVDPTHPWAQAVAITGDRIVAVGSDREIDTLRGPKTRTVKLKNHLVMPGFHDAHIHLLDGGLALQRLDLSRDTSLEQIQRHLAQFARAHPRMPWLRGFGWNYSAMRGGRLPDRRDLDRVQSARPVYLESYDGHTAWVNSRTLVMAGIQGTTLSPAGGEIVRDREGTPSGVLKEDAMNLVTDYLPRPTAEEKRQGLLAATRLARRNGITGAFEAVVAPQDLAVYGDLAREERLGIRIDCALTVSDNEVVPSAKTIEHFRRLRDQVGGPWLRVAAVKYFVDGVVETKTAALLEPYTGTRTRGSPSYTQTQLNEIVRRWDRAGFPVAMHAIGDRAVQMGLNAVAALASDRSRALRHRLEHLELIAAADFPRLARLGVVAAMQPYHCEPGPGLNLWAERVGPARLKRAFAWRSVLDAGGRLAFGSDWNVADMNPILGLATAVNRQDPAGNPPRGWVPAQRIRLEEAIRAYTLDAAYSLSEEQELGSLVPGKLADMTVLSQDVFSVPPRDLWRTRVLMTIVGGEIVYEEARPGAEDPPAAPDE